MKISGRCTRDDRRPKAVGKDFVPGRPAEPSKKGPSLTQLNDASSLFYTKKVREIFRRYFLPSKRQRQLGRDSLKRGRKSP